VRAAPWAKIFRLFGAALAVLPGSQIQSTNFWLRTLWQLAQKVEVGLTTGARVDDGGKIG
jgi:hypothetical protein